MFGITLAVISALSQAATAWIGIQSSRKEGRRRAPLEELLRNVRAAGLEPVERDGRFDLRA